MSLKRWLFLFLCCGFFPLLILFFWHSFNMQRLEKELFAVQEKQHQQEAWFKKHKKNLQLQKIVGKTDPSRLEELGLKWQTLSRTQTPLLLERTLSLQKPMEVDSQTLQSLLLQLETATPGRSSLLITQLTLERPLLRQPLLLKTLQCVARDF